VWFDVGSRQESLSTNGISHFVEHMVFKGTKNYRLRQIAESLESVGGYLNAFTSKEQTCFYARILDQYLERAISVLSDLVQHPLFSPTELKKEKQVVLEELKNLEDDPDDLIHDYFDRAVFGSHSLSFPVIGRAETINSFNRESLLAHMHRHYVPRSMVVAAAGNIRHDKLVAMVQKYFGSMSNAGSRKGVAARGPRHYRPKFETVEKPIAQAHICMGTIGYGVRNRFRYPLLVLNSVLGEGMSSRLFQNIREKYGFAYNVYSFVNMLTDTGNFGVYVGTDRNNVDKSVGLVHAELEKLKSKPLKNNELTRAKSQLKGTMMLSLESMPSRMMRLGSGELYLREYVPLDAVLNRIEAVHADHVLETANDLFRLEKFSTVVFKPADTSKLQTSNHV